MTEKDWLEGTIPADDARIRADWTALDSMLRYLESHKGIYWTSPGRHRMRLFACACVRCVWEYLDQPGSRAAVEAAEAQADGRASSWQLRDASRRAFAVAHTSPTEGDRTPRQQRAALAAAAVASHNAQDAVRLVLRALFADPALAGERFPTREDCCGLLRELFGNPFRPTTVAPEWLRWNDGTLSKIARAIHDERAPDRLPLLADALEDAGCTDPVLLDHCRGPGRHVRGCWVVDLLRGQA
jgi:hypothetical protein